MSPTTTPQGTTETHGQGESPICLYCAGTVTEPLYSGVQDRLGFVPGVRAFVRCVKCGSAVLDPLPTTSQLPDFYPPVYSFTLETSGQGKLRQVLTWLEYNLVFRPQYSAQVHGVMRACGWRSGAGKRLLDIGCGRGLRLVEFRNRGFDVAGMDVQEDVVRYLRSELHIPAHCSDVTGMVGLFAPSSFDLITTYYMIEHIPDVRTAIRNMYTLLKPGGWLAAAVPLVDSFQAGWLGSSWLQVTEAPRHLSLPTQAGMIAAYRSAGFRDVKIQPDSALNCAGQFALSLVPGGALTHAYGKSRLLPLLLRGLGAIVMVSSIPYCLVENYVFRSPSLGVVLARKPIQ